MSSLLGALPGGGRAGTTKATVHRGPVDALIDNTERAPWGAAAACGLTLVLVGLALYKVVF